MFEEKTYQYLLAQALTRAPEGIDTRQGSIYRDSMAGQMLVFASAYVDLENVIKLLRVDTAEGEYLDDVAQIFGMERKAATLATYAAVITSAPGTSATIAEGAQFYADQLYFGLYHDGSGTPYFECETEGTVGNYIQTGTEAIPMTSIDNLESATFGALITAAVDIESDGDFRARIKARIEMLGENGNRTHYKEWCEQVEGVGYARVVPLWNGPNTVKAIIFNESGGAADADVVAAVQEYVDPATQGLTATVNGVTYVVGDGWGEGTANLGAHFTASAPTVFPINITGELLLASGASIDDCVSRIQTALSAYLSSLDRNSSYGATVRFYEISSIIMNDEGVIDHYNLLVNGSTQNINLTYEQVCALGDLLLGDALVGTMLNLHVDADIANSVDLFGKTAGDLQSDVLVSSNAIAGTLKYINGWTDAYSGDEADGNFLTLHCEVEDEEGVTITAELVGGVHGPVTLDPDGIVILRITDPENQIVRVTASKTGHTTAVKTYNLTRLTLEEQA